jgi:guanylate kinase
VDYWFVDKEEFERDLAQGKFFEWAQVYDYYYGSHVGELERLVETGRPIVMIVDVQGARTLKEKIPEACTIFLEAPRAELIDRLEGRGGEIKDMERRVKKMTDELRFRSEADVVIENPEGALAEATARVAEVIRNRYHGR